MERRRVRGSAVNKEVMGLLRRLVGAMEREVEVLEETEYHYRRMEMETYDDKGDESDEDEEEDEEEKVKENTGGGVEEVTRVEMEMEMEIAEKGAEKGVDEEMGEEVEGMEVE